MDCDIEWMQWNGESGEEVDMWGGFFNTSVVDLHIEFDLSSEIGVIPQAAVVAPEESVDVVGEGFAQGQDTVYDTLRNLVFPTPENIKREVLRDIMIYDLGLHLNRNQKREKEEMLPLLESKREYILCRLREGGVVSGIQGKINGWLESLRVVAGR
jgi:hypothetical protein